jgi:hypothetical protein
MHMKRLAMLLALTIFTALPCGAAVSPSDAKAAFEALRALTGTWTSKSTKGWTETSTYELAARESVLVNRSHFDGEPGDGMLTTIYLDGSRLLLTHYCEARNQPTLVASTIENGGKRIVFTFLSGTNLSSRDAGHMDSVIMDLIDPDHFRSRWSWYERGKETWFEEVESVRAR